MKGSPIGEESIVVVRDPGCDVRVEIEHSEWLVVAWVYFRGQTVGKADFSLSGPRAELMDIIIRESLPLPGLIARVLRLRRYYRRRGLGTTLTSECLDYLRSVGVREVYGQMGGGEPGVQTAWYRSMGFEVRPDRSIRKALNPGRPAPS